MACKEVKTIKNSKSIRVCAFVFVLMLILLLSSMKWTAVWAKTGKPDEPGKPPSEPETADYEIRIGEGNDPQHMTLNPPDSVLLIEDLGYSGRWLPPPIKGKRTLESWAVILEQSEGEYCGKYMVNAAELADVLTSNGFDSNLEAYRFIIHHIIQDSPRVGEDDYWYMAIQWEVGTWVYPNPPPDEIPRFLVLSGNTNTDADWGGTYDQDTDTWSITFDNAEFQLHENTSEQDDPDTGSAFNRLWDGQLSFTVEIQRIL